MSCSRRRRGLRSAGLSLIGILVAVSFAAGEAPPGEAHRVVAVGDVHGARGPLLAALRATRLVDESGRWIGGSSTLVQTGDLVERGIEVKAVLELMMSLQEQAEAAGGRVVVLLGNHEVSNLLAYLDYKSTPPEIYSQIFAAFTDEKSEDRRKRALKQWTRWRTRFPQCGRQSKKQWEEAHPPGFVEYFEALSPEGRYGRWLRSLPAFVEIDGTLFAHAGPSPWLTDQGFDTPYKVSRAVMREIEAFDAARDQLIRQDIVLPFFTLSEIYCAVSERLARSSDPSRPIKYQVPLTAEDRAQLTEILETLPSVDKSLTLRSEGPLWYRGFSKLNEDDGRRVVDDLLAQWGVLNLVVAHTPQKGNIAARFDRVFFIDTGMVYSGGHGGRAGALEIVQGRFAAVYPNETTTLAAQPIDRVAPAQARTSLASRWLDIDGKPLPFLDEVEVEEFLRTASVVERQAIPTGRNRPERLVLEQFGIRAHAIFRRFEAEARNQRLPSGEVIRNFSDSYRNEVAAYRMSRLLGIHNVPPAVARTIESVDGSVQLWVEGTISERDRSDADMHPPDPEAWRRQAATMRVFDNLINNFDRNQGNILVDPEWRIWLIDHTRSFGREPRLPDPQYVERCSRDVWERLRALDEGLVRTRLIPVLAESEIEALLERRNRLLELLRNRIAEVGENAVLFEAPALDALSNDTARNSATDSSY